MSKTTHPGLDYGHGQSNIDPETGIRYGVISQGSERLNPEAVEEIFHGPHTKDLAWEGWVERLKKSTDRVLRDVFSEFGFSDKLAERVAEQLAEELDSCDIGDGYQGDEVDPLYEHDGYKIVKCLHTDLMILKSPYYTFAQFCSPCVPGACNLDSPLDPTLAPKENKCFCLGHEWFEDVKPPYPVFTVADGAEVLS